MRPALASLAVLICLAVTAPTAHGALIIVNTTADEYGTGAGCSLREAIEAANMNAVFGGCTTGAGDDQIDLLAPGTDYARTLTGSDDDNETGDFDVGAGGLIIVGHGATIRGTDTSAGDRLFQKNGTGILHLIRVTLRDGFTTDRGGAVLIDSGSLGVTESTVTSNHANLHGGALENSGATAVFTNSTVTGNTANGDGGGIDSDSGASNTIFNNATVTRNTADADGAGTPGRGGGVSIFLGTGNLDDTIVAGNVDPTGAPPAPDCRVGGAVGTMLGSAGYNLVGNTSDCNVLVNTGDIHNADAMLAPLASNGGGTQTHGLYPTSPAVNAGDPGVCNAVDQRNVMRPVGPRCDIGAFEGTVPLPPVTAPPTALPGGPTVATPKRKCKKRKKKGAAAARKCKRKKKR
jgi:CSLREA domain-containing protein